MDICLDILLPKSLDFNSFDIEESFAEWGGEKIRREPPVYNWEQKLTFERILCPAPYKVVLSAYINIDDYYTFALKGNAISNLEWEVNKNNDVSNDPIIEFINVVLGKINKWSIISSIDDEKLSIISDSSDITNCCNLLMDSLKWENPYGILIVKQ